jgi:hypothetical protein
MYRWEQESNRRDFFPCCKVLYCVLEETNKTLTDLRLSLDQMLSLGRPVSLTACQALTSSHAQGSPGGFCRPGATGKLIKLCFPAGLAKGPECSLDLSVRAFNHPIALRIVCCCHDIPDSQPQHTSACSQQKV